LKKDKMEEKDFIKELFQEKLVQHQSPVSPELWTSVSSSISSGTTVVSSGLSLLAKSVIGGISAATVIGSVWMLTHQKTSSAKSVTPKEIKKTLVETRSNDEKTAIKPGAKPATIHSFVFLTPEIPQEDNGPSFGPGIIHNSGASFGGQGLSFSNNDSVVIPRLPLQTTISNQNINSNSVNPLTSQPTQLEIEPASNAQEEIIVLPNIFTPNGDGKNDEFSIDLSSYEFLDYSLVILDMNNQLVFKSNDTQERWNGKKIDGSNCNAGTYIYYLTGKTVSGKTISKYSSLRIHY
jgi:gliding motility-associated-like protein